MFLSVSLFSYFYLNKEAKFQFAVTMDLTISVEKGNQALLPERKVEYCHLLAKNKCIFSL